MTEQLTKARLCEYASRKAELAELEDRLRELQSAAHFPRAVQLNGMPTAHNDRAAEDMTVQYMQLTALYEGKLRELEWETVAIETAIASLPSLRRRILRMIYMDGLSVRETANRVGYSERQVKRHRDAAVSQLNIV